MKDRIRLIQDREGMSQKDFAAAVGISQASLSSIYNGRTLPTNRHVEAIHKRFPEISTDWIMFGEGEMLLNREPAATAPSSAPEQAAADGDGDRHGEFPTSLFDTPQPSTSAPAAAEPGPNAPVVIREIVKYVDKPQRHIREIQVIYDDGRLESFVPNPDKP